MGGARQPAHGMRILDRVGPGHAGPACPPSVRASRAFWSPNASNSLRIFVHVEKSEKLNLATPCRGGKINILAFWVKKSGILEI